MALSDGHLARHCVEIQERFLAAGDTKGGGHNGVTLNVYCGILGETPKRLAALMSTLKIANLPEEMQAALLRKYGAMDRRDLPVLYFKPAT